MNTISTMDFEQTDLLGVLQSSPDTALDDLPFGVIGFDEQHRVCRYNRVESTLANFPVQEVMGQHVFVELAPCLNNYLIAGRFEEAQAAGEPLDLTMPYVLTFRMRPTKVRMRLLAASGLPVRYILVDRLSGGAR